MMLLTFPKAWSSRVAMYAGRTTGWCGVWVVRVGTGGRFAAALPGYVPLRFLYREGKISRFVL